MRIASFCRVCGYPFLATASFAFQDQEDQRRQVLRSALPEEASPQQLQPTAGGCSPVLAELLGRILSIYTYECIQKYACSCRCRVQGQDENHMPDCVSVVQTSSQLGEVLGSKGV